MSAGGKRTRLGKVVGSYRPPLEAFTYWQEGGVWYVVAPSGARIETCETEDAARESARRRDERARLDRESFLYGTQGVK